MKLRRLKFKVIGLCFGIFDLIDNFFLQFIEIIAIRTDVVLIRLIWLIFNTIRMIPLKTTLTLHHLASSTIQTITIERRFMIVAEDIDKASSS